MLNYFQASELSNFLLYLNACKDVESFITTIIMAKEKQRIDVIPLEQNEHRKVSCKTMHSVTKHNNRLKESGNHREKKIYKQKVFVRFD